MRRSKIYIRFSTILLGLFVFSTGVIIQATTPESPQNKGLNYAAEITTPSTTERAAKMEYEAKKQKLERALNQYFKKAIASGKIVGAGVSIVKEDSVLFKNGFGRKNFYKKDKVNGETVFRLGSLSKGFTGVLAAKVKVEGSLDWDDKVSNYVPEFQLGNQENTDKVTLGTILSHTSGTPYHSYTNLVEAGMSLSEIAKRFKEVQPISAPGEMYSYQNAMFALSSEVMLGATGKDINYSLEKELFNPLEMCSTNMTYEDLAKLNNVALPHSRRGKGFRPLKLRNSYYNAVAAGGINSSASDMAKWMRFLLGYKPEVMESSSIEEVFQPIIEIKGHQKYYHRWPGHIASYYGYGWRIHTYKDEADSKVKTIWHHGGSVNNFRNEIALFPEDKLGICVLFNSNNRVSRTVVPDLQKIVKEIYDTPEIEYQIDETANASLVESEH